MKNGTNIILEDLIRRYPALSGIKGNIQKAFDILSETLKSGGKALICGNGGSCADSGHIVGELMKSFKKCRPIDLAVMEKLASFGTDGKELSYMLEGALPAVSLCEGSALSTAFANDKNPYMAYAQQLYGLGQKGDTLIAISTSGNAKNCVYAALTAKAKDINVIALTGAGGGKLALYSDVLLNVPENETYRVQELHLPVYHCICSMLEEENW